MLVHESLMQKLVKGKLFKDRLVKQVCLRVDGRLVKVV